MVHEEGVWERGLHVIVSSDLIGGQEVSDIYIEVCRSESAF